MDVCSLCDKARGYFVYLFVFYLSSQLKILPPNLTLPMPWSLNKHDPVLKESRRKDLDAYLQVLLSDDKIIMNPQSFEMIILFLSDSYVRENQFLNRKVSDGVERLSYIFVTDGFHHKTI